MPCIYFDNAATTKIDSQVLESMLPWLTEKFGNPSSIYSYGREAKLQVEMSRRKVAELLSCTPGEIFFTSSGTESTNTSLIGAVRDLGCKHIISTKLEHSATQNSIEYLQKYYSVTASFLPVNSIGFFDLALFEKEVENACKKAPCLVTLMHVNNEMVNIYPMNDIAKICNKYDALLHIDAVQSVGHLPLNLNELNADFISASAHKFHGPKGSGLLYINKKRSIKPLIYGGSQERQMRAGTENPANIIGFAKALDIALENYATEKLHIQGIKEHCIQLLKKSIPKVVFNGDCENGGSYTIVSIGLEQNPKTEMLVINLDTKGVCVSSGSACSSGAEKKSGVIQLLGRNLPQSTLRISFSKFNKKEEVDRFMEILKECL